MNKRCYHIYLVFILCMVLQDVKTQQLPFYSQYFNNPFIINPAFTGFKERAQVFALHRSQWTDMPGAPIVSALTLDGPLKKEKIGLGFGVANQVWGISTRTSAFISYSYKAKIDEERSLKFGIAGGVIDNRIDFSKAIIKTANDPYIFGRNQRKTALDLNPGVAFTWSDFEIGFSVPQALNNPVRYVNSDDKNSVFTFNRHYLASVRYSLFFNREENTYIMPYVLMRTVSLATMQVDMNAVFNWKNIFWVSATYRMDYAIGLGAGFRLNKNISLGYSYDVVTNPLASYVGMSHEFTLGYAIGGKNEEDETKEKEREAQLMEIKDKLAKAEDKANKASLDNEVQATKNKAEIEKIRREMDRSNRAMIDSLVKLRKRIAEAPPVVVQAVPESPEPVITEPVKPRQEEVIKSASKKEYTNKGVELKGGYYIVIGSFKNRENAESQQKMNINRGYKNCQVVFNNLNGFTYVYLSSFSSKDQAIIELRKIKTSGFPQAWIQELK